MSLNKKTFIFTLGLVGTALLAVLISARVILISSFSELEKTRVKTNMVRVDYGVTQAVDQIHASIADWAVWDDTYYFIQDGNPNYIKSNLIDETFSTTELNLMMFIDNEAKVVYAKGFDLNNKKEVEVPADLMTHIDRSDLLITHPGRESIAGILKLDSGIMIVSSTPILKSNGSGPTMGTLVVGRYMDAPVFKKIADATQLSVEFAEGGDATFVEAEMATTGQKTIVRPVSSDLIQGFTSTLDVYGNPAFVIKAEMDRGIYSQGNTVLQYIMISLFLIGSIVVAGGVYFQEKFVLAPIYRLSNGLNIIRRKGDLKGRVEVIGQDEISRLSSDVNAMLASLHEFNRAKEENEAKLVDKLKVIESQNRELVDTKSAMLNLLDDEKELEAAMKKEHDRLDLIISSMGEGLLAISSDYKITMINPVAQKLLGISAKSAIGKKWSDIIATLKSRAETPTVERSFTKAITLGKTIITPVESNHYYKTKSGRVFPVISITAPLRVSGKIVGAVKVFRDATPEKHAKEIIEKKVVERTRELSVANTKISQGILEIESEKARLTSSINSLDAGFIIADTKYKVIVKNPAVSEILKIKSSDISIKAISKELGNGVDFEKLCRDCLNDKKSFGRDDLIFKDKFLRLFVTPVEVSGHVIGLVILIEDVTAQKQLARSKDEFFAVASHELRTPLTAIRGNTSLIMDYYAEKIKDPDLKEMISDMHESSVRLINIVNDFLDASRLEQGRVEFKKDEVDISLVTQGVMDELGGFIKERGLTIKFEAPKTPLMVIGDRDRMWQVVHNLVANSAKYTKVGGGEVALAKVGNVVKFTISDTGSGISPANQRLLFRKFQQAGERVLARDVTKGTGMGLYISKLLVEGMGGKIYLEKSELGKGSRFTFELPIKK